MSDTKIDMPKVTQMLDAGWLVSIYKGPLGSYEVRARHPSPKRMGELRAKLAKNMLANPDYVTIYGRTNVHRAVLDYDFDHGEVVTDDFTPEQALTRMAYKVHGEIL